MGVSNAPISWSTCSDDKRNRDNNRDGLIIITDFPDARPSPPTNFVRLPRLASLFRLFILSEKGQSTFLSPELF